MLNATRILLEGRPSQGLRRSLLRAIRRQGGQEDGEALAGALIADPQAGADFVEAIAANGSPELATALHAHFCVADRLRPEAPHDLLWLFGWYGLNDSAPMLLHYVSEAEGRLGTGEARPALLGLLHVPTEHIESEIRNTIDGLFDRRGLIAEYLPPLCWKLDDRDLFGRLFAHLRDHGSQDTLGGLIIAAALFGETADEELRELLWGDAFSMAESHWRDAHLGVALRGWRLADLFAAARARFALPRADAARARREASLLGQLLGWTVADPVFPLGFALPTQESAAEIWDALFGHGIDGERFPDFASRAFAAVHDNAWSEAEAVGDALALRMDEAAMIEALLSDPH